MKTLLRSFYQNDDGAVTVDWVVLTAVIIILALIVFEPIQSSAGVKTGEIVEAVNDSGG